MGLMQPCSGSGNIITRLPLLFSIEAFSLFFFLDLSSVNAISSEMMYSTA